MRHAARRRLRGDGNRSTMINFAELDAYNFSPRALRVVTATANRTSVMGKSIYGQRAARHRSSAETARSEVCRSMRLTIASEWEAMADAAAGAQSSAPTILR